MCFQTLVREMPILAASDDPETKALGLSCNALRM
jgi:hypothetical protein